MAGWVCEKIKPTPLYLGPPPAGSLNIRQGQSHVRAAKYEPSYANREVKYKVGQSWSSGCEIRSRPVLTFVSTGPSFKSRSIRTAR